MNDENKYPETADIETSSEDYASRFSGPAGEWMLGVQERIVLDLLSRNENSRVLDVGGGHGQLAVALAKKGFDVTVLGSSEECVQRIKAEVDAGKIKFQVGNLIEMPYEEDAFDVVISIRLLPHCESWKQLVKEMCRVAKQYVVVDYPTSQSLNCLSGSLFGAKKKIEGNTRPYELFKHAEVSDAFEDCGYTRSALKKEFFVPMVVHRMLKCPGVSGCLEGISKVLGLQAMFGSPVIAKFKERRREQEHVT
jgi:2-polyprenyl-3-methyl-5-hydroxy-6-metoxy-1,4-benzoquinol methylase